MHFENRYAFDLRTAFARYRESFFGQNEWKSRTQHVSNYGGTLTPMSMPTRIFQSPFLRGHRILNQALCGFLACWLLSFCQEGECEKPASRISG